MAKKTTLKPIGLGYREVGGAGAYTKFMGVLRGLTIAQDEPESTEIEAEFYDAPFDIFYQGNPVTMTFELANYDLSELPPVFGGTYTAAAGSDPESYEGAAAAYTSEKEWKLDFGRGFGSLVIFKGLTVEASNDEGAAFLYGWDGSGEAGTDSDLYFKASVGGNTYTFVIEYYLTGADSDAYKAVQGLKVGDTIDLEGFLYWYEGAQPHITTVTVK
jgi:hypothetical protein